MSKLKCVICKRWIYANEGDFVECPFCGARYLWKIRSKRFVYIGGGKGANTRTNNEKDN